MRETVEPTINEYGAETHPAFGQIHASRTSQTPGAVLFQSDIRHQHTVRIVIETADRRRDLHHDYVHGGKQLFEVEMSEAQWASFVSSMNTSGVPCTIRATPDNWHVPELPYDPRLAHSMREVREGATKTFGKIKEAFERYEQALKDKAPAKERNAALSHLRAVVSNTEGNLAFAAKSLNAHAEDVVQKARADIEAMVGAEAQRLGLTGETSHLLELPMMPGEEASP